MDKSGFRVAGLQSVIWTIGYMDKFGVRKKYVFFGYMDIRLYGQIGIPCRRFFLVYMDTRLYGQIRSEKKITIVLVYMDFFGRVSGIFFGYIDFFGRVAAFFLTNKKSQKKTLKKCFFFSYMDFLNLLRVAVFFSVIWTLGYMDKKDRFWRTCRLLSVIWTSIYQCFFDWTICGKFFLGRKNKFSI